MHEAVVEYLHSFPHQISFVKLVFWSSSFKWGEFATRVDVGAGEGGLFGREGAQCPPPLTNTHGY